MEKYCSDKTDELRNLKEEQKNNARSKQEQRMENALKNMESDISSLADVVEESSNDDVKVQAFRVRGDKAEALGDYCEAIEHYMKWKDARTLAERLLLKWRRVWPCWAMPSGAKACTRSRWNV